MQPQFLFPPYLVCFSNNSGSRIKWIRPAFMIGPTEDSGRQPLYGAYCVVANSRCSQDSGQVTHKTELVDSFDRATARFMLESAPDNMLLTWIDEKEPLLQTIFPLDGSKTMQEVNDLWIEMGLTPPGLSKMLGVISLSVLPEGVPLTTVLMHTTMSFIMGMS